MAVNVKWVGLYQFFGCFLQFVVWAILARLLPPGNFGALAVFGNGANDFAQGLAAANPNTDTSLYVGRNAGSGKTGGTANVA